MRCGGATCWRVVPFWRSKSEVEICPGRDQFFDAEEHSSAHRDQTPFHMLFDDLPGTDSRIGHNRWFFRAAWPVAFEAVDQDGEDACQRESGWLPSIA